MDFVKNRICVLCKFALPEGLQFFKALICSTPLIYIPEHMMSVEDYAVINRELDVEDFCEIQEDRQ